MKKIESGLGGSYQTSHMMVDLHGLSPEQAKSSVNRYLSLAVESNITEFRFVTGRGNHINSQGKRGTLYQEFSTWIAEENLSKIAIIHKGDGYYEVHMKPVIKKQGVISHFFETLATQVASSQIEDIKKQAELGDDDFQLILGFCYQSGMGVIKDEKKAMQWFQKSAEQKNAMAQHYLGGCYWQGKGVRKDEKKAIEYFEAAASQNYEYPLDQLGDCYCYGEGVKLNYAKAFEYYEKAANLGLNSARRKLAHAYFWGRGVEKNDKKAVELYKKAADEGDSHSAYNLACSYLNGIGTEKNIVLCMKYATQSADKCDPDAQFFLFKRYYYGIEVKADEKKALEYLKEAANNGHKDALFQLAHQSEMVQDVKTHLNYLLAAAKAGQIVAQAMVLPMFHDDILRTMDLNEAEQNKLWEDFWKQEDEDIYKLAEEDKLLVLDTYISRESHTKKQKNKILKLLDILADQDNPAALLRLGALYREGQLVKQNTQKAKDYWIKGSELGSDECFCSLGYYYEKGIESDGKPDYKKAFDYHQKAAEKGSANSHNQLGLMYQNGKGVDVDIEKAIYHFKEAMELDASEKNSIRKNRLNHTPVLPYATLNLGALYWKLNSTNLFFTQEEKKELRLMEHSIYYLLKSEDAGHPDARKLLDKLGVKKKEKTPSYQEISTASFWKPQQIPPEKPSLTPTDALKRFAEKMELIIEWKTTKDDKAWGYISENKIDTLQHYDIFPARLEKTTKGQYILLIEQLSKQNFPDLLPKLKTELQNNRQASL